MNPSSNAEQLLLAKIDASKRYLAAVRSLAQKAQSAETEYRLAVERSSGLSGIDYSRDTVSTSVSPDAIPNAVLRYEVLREQLDILKAASDEATDKCFELLQGIDSEHGSVLRMSYLLGLTSQQIATSLYISERTVRRWRDAGLVELYDQGLPMEYRINYQKAI